MSYLIDTHVFIWMNVLPDQLSADVAKLLKDKSNSVYLSVVSAWEMTIKMQIGTLTFGQPLSEMIEVAHTQDDIGILNVELSDVLKVGELPRHHKDSFDCLLIAQALTRNLTFITKDKIISQYNVPIYW